MKTAEINPEPNQALIKQFKACLQLELTDSEKVLLQFAIFTLEHGLEDYLATYLLSLFKGAALWVSNEEKFLCVR
jgi:hypothetical protein